jgi:hypothetical protein
MLGGGARAEILVFCRDLLMNNYTYADGGNILNVMDESELHELHYLAELCGRNKLVVHRPSQLTSAIDPCLTFDRNAHVAVYLGEQGCSEPGRSSLVFRPLTGTTETPDAAVVEQLIEPIIKTYESEGTGIFDHYGGAAVRRLEAPDEILMFCVDCSASMRKETDFAEINEDDNAIAASEEITRPLVEGDYYAEIRYEDVKDELCKHESFKDMIAIVASAATGPRRKQAATAVLALLVNITAGQLSTKMEEVDRFRQIYRYGPGALLDPCNQEVKRQKSFYAGLHTHEQQIKDLLIYRATTFVPGSTRWTWALGDDVPSSSAGSSNIPMLDDELTQIPDDLRCLISQEILVDAIKAADGHIYSRHALQQWFAIRKSSPLHGTTLRDTSMSEASDIIQAALQWIEGDGLIETSQLEDDDRPSKKRRSASSTLVSLNFNSHLGGFVRTVPKNFTLDDLYKLAFRGLKARHNVFQLIHSDTNCVILPSSIRTVST